MSLRPRQTYKYEDVCSIYRKNKSRAANGEITYTLLTSNIPCKHYTQPNYDTPKAGGGLTMTKEGNIFTSDILHLDAVQDIAAEDVVALTASPNTNSKMVWFRVAGEPETRFGVANRSSVYLVPAPEVASRIV